MNDKYLTEIIDFSIKNPNCVVHLTIGIVSEKLLEKLYDKNLKVLILGYKIYGRDEDYYSKKIEEKMKFLKNNILDISRHFYVMSFDNLAITQLNIKNQISREDFMKYYMGDVEK